MSVCLVLALDRSGLAQTVRVEFPESNRLHVPGNCASCPIRSFGVS